MQLWRITVRDKMTETEDSHDSSSHKLPSESFIDTNTLLLRFDGRSRLLLRALLSGAAGDTGARRALWLFQRQRGSDPDFSLHTCLGTLCQEDICSGNATQPLTAKPLVCLFPAAFQHTLLSFLHLVHSVLPRTSVLQLLDCLSQEPTSNPWVSALIVQLRRDLGDPGKEPLFTPQCSERLRGLGKPLGGGAGKTTGWASYFSRPTGPRPSQSGLELPDRVSKRKSSSVFADSDTEGDGRPSKRTKMDLSSAEGICSSEGAGVQTEGLRDGLPQRVDGLSNEASRQSEEPPAEVRPCDALSELMKASIPRFKELLDSEMEWDQSSVDLLNVLNDCDPSQVEVLCGMLSLSEIPEQALLQLCSALLALSPDLSYSTAAALINHLLLGKVVSLSEPASRCLVSAVTSLCSRYPRPTCYALIGPVLEAGETGSAQAELLNRLIDDCLEPHYRLLVFEMTLRGVWSEGLLTVIHGLLDSKLELNEELFTLFTEQLNIQAPQFTKSMKFAKMMLTVLTKYNSHVTSAHVKTLSCCLSSNKTFLAKSLQAALKRITT